MMRALLPGFRVAVFGLLLVLSLDMGAAYAASAWSAKVIYSQSDKPGQSIKGEVISLEQLAWDFNDDDLEGLSDWQGVTTPRVDGGKLKFRTKKDARLIWGDIDRKHPEYGELGIGSDWWQSAWPWAVRMRVRQNVPEATWKLEAAYMRHSHVRRDEKSVKVSGGAYQTIQFNMKTTGREDIHALSISIDAKGAEVEIDSIEVVRPSLPIAFWTDFNLVEKPVVGDIAIVASGKIDVYVNGIKLASHAARHPFSRRINRLVITDYLQTGQNKLCVEMEGYTSHSRVEKPGQQFFFMEGAVLDRSGNTQRVASGKSWNGVQVVDGCSRLHQVKSRPIKVLGRVADNWLALKGVTEDLRLGDVPYFGPLGLKFRDNEFPFYSENKDVVLDMNVIGASAKYAGSVVKYHINEWRQDRREKTKRITNGQLPADSRSINLGRLKPGTYELIVELWNGGRLVDQRLEELIIAGKIIGQRRISGSDLKNGLQLKLVSSIDFSSKPPSEILCSAQGGNQKRLSEDIRDGSWRTYRSDGGRETLMLPGGRHSWCSVKLEVERLYEPHLLEIRYPAKQDSNMIFVLSEESRFPRLHNLRNDAGVVRLNSGIHTDGSSSGVGVARYLYWPNRGSAALTIVNADTGPMSSGQIDRISLYEIENRLPAWQGRDPDRNNLLIGSFVERIDRTTPRMFYAGPLEAKFSRDQVDGYFPGYYSAWYQTIANLIEYMKFSGQNAYFAGVYMYYGGWFPSIQFQGNPTSGVDDLPLGWRGGALELMARMFEENDLDLILGVQFIGSRSLRQMDRVSDLDVINGEATLRFVNDAGRQVRGFQGLGYNFLIPEVERQMLDLAEEIADRFSRYPAIKGVTWMRLPEFPAADSNSTAYSTPLNVGYGDYTISRYVADTHSNLPKFGNNLSTRFGKRKEWLMENERDAWLDWRSSKVWEMDNKLYKVFTRSRPDLKYWHIVSLRSYPELLGAWDAGHLDNAAAVYKTMGVDTSMYQDNPGPRLMFLKDIGADRKYARNRSRRALSGPASDFYQDKHFASVTGYADILVNVGFMVETTLKAKKQWPWQRLRVVGNSIPVDAGGILSGLRSAPHALSGRAIAIGWSDAGHFSGYEQLLREFLKGGANITH